jgi:hypothetical protein
VHQTSGFLPRKEKRRGYQTARLAKLKAGGALPDEGLTDIRKAYYGPHVKMYMLVLLGKR